MPSRDRRIRLFIDDFLLSRREEWGICEKTYKKYRTVLSTAVDALEKAGLEVFPKNFTKKEILFLRNNVFIGNSLAHNRWQLSIVGSWLKWYDNKVLEKMRLRWPEDERINVDWLEPEEAIRVKNSAIGMEKLVIHLELNLGLRRIDMHRLTLQRIKEGSFEVLGKGICGGKYRTISWDDDTPGILNEYFTLRDKIIKDAKKKNPMVKIPDSLLIYQKGKRVGQYQLTAIDNVVPRVAKRAGIDRKITNHTLRRTCGRILYKSGNDLTAISNILGHADVKTTIRYLGLKLDDQKIAFSKKSHFLKNIETEMIRID